MPPGPSSMGGGSVCCRRRICLRQQTTATRWRRPLPAGLLRPANARCNGAPLSKTKMKADLASRASVFAALAISSPSSRKVTPCWPRALVPAASAISFPSSRKVTPRHHLPRTKPSRSTPFRRSRLFGVLFRGGTIDRGTLQRSEARSRGSVASTVGRCNGLRMRSFKPRRSPSPTVQPLHPLSRAQLLHQVQTHPSPAARPIPTPVQRVSPI